MRAAKLMMATLLAALALVLLICASAALSQAGTLIDNLIGQESALGEEQVKVLLLSAALWAICGVIAAGGSIALFVAAKRKHSSHVHAPR
ncbi:hypothetical protein [Mycetocola sp.]|uniref:hypothetical protein n=1 Tax=Mycetocola sp. TaxID=1871042 RepID=UPI003989ADEA